jgi:Domain of unknown function (DUF4381)
MKSPKRWPNRVRKNLIPDAIDLKKVEPLMKKNPLSMQKLPMTDWRKRWFLSFVAMALASSALMAQGTTSTGPVVLPSSPATNAVTAPSFAPAAAPNISYTPSTSQSAMTSDTGDIRDIRGPISIPYEWLWAAYTLAALAAAAALYGAWRWYRTHAKLKARLPFEIALDRLEAAKALLAENKVREYAFTVSEVIRVYIEQRFGEKAARRTTEEFLSDLLQQTGTPLAQHRRRLEDFLNYCDLMKFARWEASPRDLESMHESAREFVMETRPLPEAKAGPTVSPAAPAQSQLAQAK